MVAVRCEVMLLVSRVASKVGSYRNENGLMCRTYSQAFYRAIITSLRGKLQAYHEPLVPF